MRFQLNPLNVLAQSTLLTTAYCQDWTFTNPHLNTTYVKGQPALITWNTTLGPDYHPPYILDLGAFTTSGEAASTTFIQNLSRNLTNNGSFTGWTPSLNMSNDGGINSMGYRLMISSSGPNPVSDWLSQTFLLVDPPVSSPSASSSISPTPTSETIYTIISTSDSSSSDSSHGTSAAVIWGVAGGIIGGAIIIALVAFVIMKQRRKVAGRPESKVDFGSPQEGRNSWDRAVTALRTLSTN